MKTKHVAITLDFPWSRNLIVEVLYPGSDDEGVDKTALLFAIERKIHEAIMSAMDDVDSDFLVVDSDIAKELEKWDWDDIDDLKKLVTNIQNGWKDADD